MITDPYMYYYVLLIDIYDILQLLLFLQTFMIQAMI